MRAAIYHRVSTLDQNPDAAREELRAAARARGFEVVAEVEETASGAKADRAGLLRVMDLAKRGKVQAVVVWKLDRFGRSTVNLLQNVEDLKRAGVRFVATSQGIDVGAVGDPMGNFMLTILAGVAEFERALIRERTVLGMKRARALGVHCGRRPLPPEKQEAIREKWEAGVDAYWTAKGLGLKQSTVRTYFARFEAARKGSAESEG